MFLRYGILARFIMLHFFSLSVMEGNKSKAGFINEVEPVDESEPEPSLKGWGDINGESAEVKNKKDSFRFRHAIPNSIVAEQMSSPLIGETSLRHIDNQYREMLEKELEKSAGQISKSLEGKIKPLRDFVQTMFRFTVNFIHYHCGDMILPFADSEHGFCKEVLRLISMSLTRIYN